VNTPKLFIQAGISGTGKGVRVSSLLEFLKTKFACESYVIEECNGFLFKNPPQIAVTFPEIKVAFIGKWVRSNKGERLISFQGLDAYSFDGGKSYPALCEYFLSRGFHLFVEGYFAFNARMVNFLKAIGYLLNDRSIPEFAGNKYFPSIVHWLYSDVEELQQRMLQRSGSRIKGTCWGDNKSCNKPENQKIRLKEMQEFSWGEGRGIVTPVEYSFKNAQEDPIYYGMVCLAKIGYSDLAKQYAESGINTHRSVNDPEGNSKYSRNIPTDSSTIHRIKISDKLCNEIFTNPRGGVKKKEA